ncbi:MAG: glycosyltransferase family 4 protein [Actinomycetota bacterium]|nr:glycosyltransferase family 4 protein [Actinomycetota bacterium]
MSPHPSLRVLRLCSVFEALDHVVTLPGAARFDPIGGMQNSTAQLTRCLDAAGVRQIVVTSWLAGPRSRDREGGHATIVRTGASLHRLGQLWALAAVPIAAQAAVDLVHAHQGRTSRCCRSRSPRRANTGCRWSSQCTPVSTQRAADPADRVAQGIRRPH